MNKYLVFIQLPGMPEYNITPYPVDAYTPDQAAQERIDQIVTLDRYNGCSLLVIPVVDYSWSLSSLTLDNSSHEIRCYRIDGKSVVFVPLSDQSQSPNVVRWPPK